MKAVIPTAGQGTRLYPHTHSKPKSMVRLAGKPILGHILSNVADIDVEEVVIVVGGPMQNQVVRYAREAFGHRFELTFVEQKHPKGLGHGIYQTKDAISGEAVLITLGDMLFESGYRDFLDEHRSGGDVDGSIGLKPVSEPEHYGIVELDESGRITNLVEKPDHPPSTLAVSGVYIVENTAMLLDALEYVVENSLLGAGGEYQLTDALDRMVRQGATLEPFEVEEWYDCGRPETLLEANRVTLDRLETNGTEQLENSVVIEPVDFGTDVRLEGSVIGPHVSIDDGATIRDSIVRDSIVGQNASLRTVNFERSIVGDSSEVVGSTNRLNLGDNSSIIL